MQCSLRHVKVDDLEKTTPYMAHELVTANCRFFSVSQQQAFSLGRVILIAFVAHAQLIVIKDFPLQLF